MRPELINEIRLTYPAHFYHVQPRRRRVHTATSIWGGLEEEDDDAEDQIYDLSFWVPHFRGYHGLWCRRIKAHTLWAEPWVLRECRLYLVREDLRPNPRTFSAWQRLFHGKSDGDHRRDMSQSEQGWSDQSGLETRIWSVEGVRRSRLDEDLEVGWAPSAELKSEDLMPGFTA